jgi:ABC-type multidrug transport system ATPase subunit/pSer/pThr/pTyr-binding forkhead associated (FHA) protein
MAEHETAVQPTLLAILQSKWVGGSSDTLPLSRSVIRIGRGLDNDIVVEHPSVSTHHLEMTIHSGSAEVRDLQSRNGSVVGGQRLPALQPISVQFGMTIRLAGCLDIQLVAVDPTAPAASTPERVFLRPQGTAGLVIWPQGGKLMHLALDDQPVRIGRSTENDVVISHPAVSRQHAEVFRQPDGWHVRDLQSSQGVISGQTRIQEKLLTPGDTFFLGNQVMLQFRPLNFVSETMADLRGRRTPAASKTQLIQLEGKNTIRIGRATDNDICIPDGRVSRYHAIIERVGMNYRVRDLRSDNGTFVNERRVERETAIKPDDVIQVAATRFRFAANGLLEADKGHGLRLDLIRLHKRISAGKDLLQDISLSIPPCSFVALVGTSGAGKSTLLDAMNGFRPASQGQVLINGVSLYDHFDAFRSELGYVPQDDIMHRELSVFEALEYAGRLRMPADTSAHERAKRVNEVLGELDLLQQRDLPIHKLSGGQRKRVSIGIELLTKPRLFFLDEATSGLDPGTETELMQLLRTLTSNPREGRTIVLVTHATKNVSLCDLVIFLTRGGYLAFFGTSEEALTYFEQYWSEQERRLKPTFEFDDIYNLLDPEKALRSGATEQQKLAAAAEWSNRYRRSSYYRTHVIEGLRHVKAGDLPANQETETRKRPQVSAVRQFGILSSRYWAVMRRDPKNLLILLLQAPLIGVMSFINANQAIFDRDDGNPMQALTTIFLAVIIVLLFGTVNSAREITKEISVYRRERMVNLEIGPYILSKVFVGILLCLYQVAVYLAFTLLSTDWPPMSTGDWAGIYTTLTLASMSGIMLGLLLSSLSSTDGQAVALIPVILIPQFIFAGVLMPDLVKSMPAASQIATSKWAVAALATITQADRAGEARVNAQKPDLTEQNEKARKACEAQMRLQIQAETERIVNERLEAEVQKVLAVEVQKETDRVIREQTESAQNKAEADARRRGGIFITEQDVRNARQQAAAQVASKRPQVEAQVRAQMEPQIRLQVREQLTNAVRPQVEASVHEEMAKTGKDCAQVTVQLPEIPNPLDQLPKELFDTPPWKAWGAMTTIMLVLLGMIFVSQYRKDVR